MNPDTAREILFALAAYLSVGSAVAVSFVIFEIGRGDPRAIGAPRTFRVLVLPGCIALWPFVLYRWMRSGSAR